MLKSGTQKVEVDDETNDIKYAKNAGKQVYFSTEKTVCKNMLLFKSYCQNSDYHYFSACPLPDHLNSTMSCS